MIKKWVALAFSAVILASFEARSGYSLGWERPFSGPMPVAQYRWRPIGELRDPIWRPAAARASRGWGGLPQYRWRPWQGTQPGAEAPMIPARYAPMGPRTRGSLATPIHSRYPGQRFRPGFLPYRPRMVQPAFRVASLWYYYPQPVVAGHLWQVGRQWHPSRQYGPPPVYRFRPLRPDAPGPNYVASEYPGVQTAMPWSRDRFAASGRRPSGWLLSHRGRRPQYFPRGTFHRVGGNPAPTAQWHGNVAKMQAVALGAPSYRFRPWEPASHRHDRRESTAPLYQVPPRSEAWVDRDESWGKGPEPIRAQAPTWKRWRPWTQPSQGDWKEAADT
jgi:hypothetical protein